jgi:hypothetical protein
VLSSSAYQETPLLWKEKIHYSTHKSQPFPAQPTSLRYVLILSCQLRCTSFEFRLTDRLVVALGYWLDDRRFETRQRLRIFLFTIVSRLALGPTQPPIQWVPGALSLGVKRLGYEDDHSPPPSSEVKNAWSYTSTPQYAFMAWCLVKHRDNFTLPYLMNQ